MKKQKLTYVRTTSDFQYIYVGNTPDEDSRYKRQSDGMPLYYSPMFLGASLDTEVLNGQIFDQRIMNLNQQMSSNILSHKAELIAKDSMDRAKAARAQRATGLQLPTVPVNTAAPAKVVEEIVEGAPAPVVNEAGNGGDEEV